MIYRSRVKVFDDLPPEEVELPDSLQAYAELQRRITEEQDPAVYQALLRLWTAADNYYLLRFVLSAGRDAWDEFRHEPHFEHEVHIRFAREVQFSERINDTVIVGARGLGKSTQFDADDIRDVLIDPNHSTYYFSLTKGLTQKRIGSIKTELDTNEILKYAWPDRFWRDQEERDATGRAIPWSETSGLCCKRTTTRPEQTFEAHSFEHSLPTGMHPDKKRYDDIEGDRSVQSELTQETLKERWVSSQNITSSKRRRRVTGTYYAANALMVMLSHEFGLKRSLYPGEDIEDPVPPEEAGPLGGRPVNGFTREHLWRRLADVGGAELDEEGNWRRTSNPKALLDYARQTACDPRAGEATKLDWNQIRHYEGDGWRYAREGTIMICADCSTGGTEESMAGLDFTFIWVWLLTKAKEFWWVDGEMKRVKPLERRKLIHEVTQRWINYGARVEQLRLEQFGQATYVQDQREFWEAMPAFPAPVVIKCNDNRSPRRGEGKTWSIYERWQPKAAAGKIVFPHEMWRQDETGKPIELVGYVKEWEWELFPRCRTDNGLDAGKLAFEDEKRVGPLPWPKDDRWSLPRREPKPVHAQSAGLA